MLCRAVQDVFSMGCVIAELFLENRALFDLSKVPLSQPAILLATPECDRVCCSQQGFDIHGSSRV